MRLVEVLTFSPTALRSPLKPDIEARSMKIQPVIGGVILHKSSGDDRMIVASFLVKDLHLEWTLGAEHFEKHLSDFDPASNSHGWQWTAGCGTDASPYYRIFNPILQGLKFDPNGDYVRKYVPELRHLEGSAAHEPWEVFDGYSDGYPVQIVDHTTERNESLARLEEIKVS